MNAADIARLINAALQILATVQRMGVATDEIKARLDSGEEITAEDVQAALDRLQGAIGQGRAAAGLEAAE